jgi:hypothetical protein
MYEGGVFLTKPPLFAAFLVASLKTQFAADLALSQTEDLPLTLDRGLYHSQGAIEPDVAIWALVAWHLRGHKADWNERSTTRRATWRTHFLAFAFSRIIW